MDLSKQNTLVLIDDRVKRPVEDLPNAMDWIVTQSIFTKVSHTISWIYQNETPLYLSKIT